MTNDFAWQRPSAADACARLTPSDPEAGCVVLRVPAASLDRAWQRSARPAQPAEVTTTAASITFGRVLATLQRTRTAPMPLVRYAGVPSAGGGPGSEITFVDGRDVLAAAIALGATDIEIVVPSGEAERFLADVGGQLVGPVV
jgi:hypothetical protein